MNNFSSSAPCNCGCCTATRRLTAPIPHDLPPLELPSVNRRGFLGAMGGLAALSLTLPSLSGAEAEACCSMKARAPLSRKPLRIQPVLTYDTPKRQEANSWRNWGGIHTDEAAQQEQARIASELKKLAARAEFPLEVRPVQLVKSVEQAGNIAKGDHDVMLMYAAGGGLNVLETLTRKDRFNLMFLRHLPGPAYLWYEIVHPRFLRKTVDEYGQPGMDVHDVITDSYDEMLWKLRALHGLNSTHGKRVVCIGGAAGWGEGGQKAPQISRDLWKLDLIDYPYKDLEPRLVAAYKDSALVAGCEKAANAYLGKAGVKLETTRQFVTNAFVLREVFLDVMEQHQTDALTVNACMGTIMGMSKTTACLTLSLLNDDGYLLFCESDFVVIPSGILLHYISGKPVFLNDPTTPHDGIVTLAHCTAPRRMDGKRMEKARILTHFESDYGAAPKVEMKLGQITTNLVPDFNCQKWVGFAGTIVGNPFLEICRSQIDVKVQGDGQKLLEEMKGFHWMLSYGDYLKECGYALNKLGVNLLNVSAKVT
jgi:hypothetical protein